jgi:hypothetical protein
MFMLGIVEIVVSRRCRCCRRHNRQIPRSLTSSKHGLVTDLVTIVRLAQPGHDINETLGEIQIDRAEFTGGIVLRERVMIIVKSFTDRAQAHEQILRRTDALVVGSIAPFVRRTVDQPGDMQREHVAEHGGHEIGHLQRLAPGQPGQHGRIDEAAQNGQRFVVLFLIEHHRIGEQIVQGYARAFARHIRMLFHEQPADVSEKEAALGIVRIGVRLRVFVVHPVISTPLIYGILI